MLRRFGVLYQSGALWSSMTLAENVGLPLEEFTDLVAGRDPRGGVAEARARRAARASRTSSRRRSAAACRSAPALARAMALDPEILFFDEPSAGLDPISSRLLDDLILELRDSLGATIVVVTHELASIFTIGTNSVFLDAETRTMTAQRPAEGAARPLRHATVREFLTRRGGGRRGGPRGMSKRPSPTLIGAFVLGALAPRRARRRGLRLGPALPRDGAVRAVLHGLGERAQRRARRSSSRASRSARSPTSG